MSLSALGPKPQRGETEDSPGGCFLLPGCLCWQEAMARAASFREHHVPVTFCHQQVQCHRPSSAQRHLSSTSVQKSKSTCSAVPVRHYSPRSPHCFLKILKCVKLSQSLWSNESWIFLCTRAQLHHERDRVSACLPDCPSAFLFPQPGTSLGHFPGCWKALDQKVQANVTDISRFLNEYTDSGVTILAEQLPLLCCEEQVITQDTSAPENVRIQCVSSRPPPHDALLNPTRSLRSLLSLDPISRVWAHTGSKTFSVEALKTLQTLRTLVPAARVGCGRMFTAQDSQTWAICKSIWKCCVRCNRMVH